MARPLPQVSVIPRESLGHKVSLRLKAEINEAVQTGKYGDIGNHRGAYNFAISCICQHMRNNGKKIQEYTLKRKINGDLELTIDQFDLILDALDKGVTFTLFDKEQEK